MSGTRRGQLFLKYVVLFAALVSGALLASGALQMIFAYRDTSAALGRFQREQASAATARIEQFLSDMERGLAWATQVPPDAGPGALEQRLADYVRLLRLESAITDIRYLNPAGREELFVSRLSPNVIGSGIDFSGDARFQRTRRGATYFSGVEFRGGSEPYMTVALAERGGDAGVTTADINLKLIWDVVSQIKIGEAGYAYVVDQAGLLVAHPDIAQVLRRTDLSALEQVQEALATPDPGGRAGPPTIIAPSARGGQVLTSFQRIPATGWVVFVEQPLEEAFAPVDGALRRTGQLLFVGLLISLLASLVVARRMVAPIHALQAGAERIGAGALDQRIEVRTGDELEALAEEFNRMSAQLQESYESLEQKVEERTRDLAVAVQGLEEKSRLLEMATAEAEAARGAAEAANQAKSQALISLSHELRTPLNAIIGYSEHLAEEAVDQGQAGLDRDLQRISTAGYFLLKLSDDILDLAKLEIELYLESFSIAPLMQDVVMLVAPMVEKNANTLEVQAAADLGTMYADRTRVQQSLLNLLNNAAKFTLKGTITLDVWRELGQPSDAIIFRIVDTGIGMTPEQMSRLFQAFSQAEPTTSIYRSSGTGLGLALSRKFCRLMGGDITVESERGQGSTFTIRLPAVVPSPTPRLNP